MPVDPSRLAPSNHGQAHRRRVGVAVAILAVVGLLLLVLRPGSGSGLTSPAPTSTSSEATAESDRAQSDASADAAPATESSRSTDASPSSTARTPSSPSSTPHTLPSYRTTGEFAVASGSDTVRGESGQLMTYRVEAEKGSGVTSEEFATAIDRILRHPRGWTAGGHWRFQRVGGKDADLIIRLATPDSVDAQCAAAGANTQGYTSCRTGQYILVNLDRWYLAVPHITDLDLYREYLINHEVGHGLGKGHEACPGKGEVAPVMLQQTLDLDGCRANAWPRDPKGRLVTGPPTE